MALSYGIVLYLYYEVYSKNTNKILFELGYKIYARQICDMIKWNESDVADIAFEICAKKESQFCCFILF